MTTASELRAALDLVLSSRTFRRSDQLKKLLTYLAEQLEAGRALQVTEYELGVEALGRPASFSPEVDSGVRTRVHALRQKLEEYYTTEREEAVLRLDLPKGSYVLELVRAPQPAVESPAPPPPAVRRWRRWAAAAALGSVLAAAAVFALRPADPLTSLWRPMLESKLPAAILVGQPLHVWVRDMDTHGDSALYAPFPDPLPDSDSFRRFVHQRLPNPGRLVLHPSPNATLWGDVAGAASAARFLAFRGAPSELLPESSLKGEIALRGRPLVVFGRPEFSPAVARYLASAGGYTIGMNERLREFAIYRSDGSGKAFVNTPTPNEVNHGLVTVLQEGASRVFVFTGVTSDGSMAGLDYLINEDSVRQLHERLAREGHATWPSVFQVVVRTVSSIGYSMGVSYETHLVLKR